MKTSLVTPYIFAALLVILAANGGLTVLLGAHPFWSVSIAWVGVPIGLIAALTVKSLDWRWSLRIALFAVLLGLAYLTASLGKERFAASFAEDAFAGRLWYFGWIAVAASATALISALFSPTKTHPDP
ncbi:MAG: hypothetical protein KJO42_08335 [Silicimonas sp.]|nr:hypothetical protein [Silicimonas sp.]MBT8425594.1 hypothetical protein [Silicimonas sp.]NNL36072.1 hypothetical protein [Silicimonas sp.]NNL73452.1 hypothetical protein [Silicimonas sp.]RZW07702.1 MAG: hypothetical protein EX266_06165 [Paracoccaceae bacterium]